MTESYIKGDNRNQPWAAFDHFFINFIRNMCTIKSVEGLLFFSPSPTMEDASVPGLAILFIALLHIEAGSPRRVPLRLSFCQSLAILLEGSKLNDRCTHVSLQMDLTYLFLSLTDLNHDNFFFRHPPLRLVPSGEQLPIHTHSDFSLPCSCTEVAPRSHRMLLRPFCVV
jgi:hypothetical protein